MTDQIHFYCQKCLKPLSDKLIFDEMALYPSGNIVTLSVYCPECDTENIFETVPTEAESDDDYSFNLKHIQVVSLDPERVTDDLTDPVLIKSESKTFGWCLRMTRAEEVLAHLVAEEDMADTFYWVAHLPYTLRYMGLLSKILARPTEKFPGEKEAAIFARLNIFYKFTQWDDLQLSEKLKKSGMLPIKMDCIPPTHLPEAKMTLISEKASELSSVGRKAYFDQDLSEDWFKEKLWPVLEKMREFAQLFR